MSKLFVGLIDTVSMYGLLSGVSIEGDIGK